MEKSLSPDDIKLILESNLTEKEINQLNPLSLAWIGDSVFSNYVRKFLVVHSDSKIGKLHKKSTKYVKAQAQAKLVLYLFPQLNDREREIFKKGRNTSSAVPKHSTVADYRQATGFEALIGYLELTGQNKRLQELCRSGINYLYESEK